jgi:glyoxylase-like metal-dependent hydrolase (beta-lactamase superfamily II)
MKVLENIFVFQDSFSTNIYVIDNELIVDTGIDANPGKVIKSMLAQGIDLKKIKIILNTHAHCDHVRGNKKFKELTKAEIYAHKLDAKNIEIGKALCDLFSLKPIPTKVDERLKGNEKIITPNHKFTVIHTPGHTEGSICLYEQKKKILISGDTLFSDSVGRFDLPGGSKKKLINSLKKLSELDIKVLLPGHGEHKKGDINKLINFLLSIL